MWDTLERIHKDSRNACLDSDKFPSGSSSASSKINICLMEKEDFASKSVSTSSSTKCDSYYQLLEAFKVTYEETHRLTLSNNQVAHIHMHHLNKLISNDLVIGLPKLKFKKDHVCEACQKGKQTKRSFKL